MKFPALIGRHDEAERIRACLKAHRNVLLEGPVGVGKTELALALTRELKRPVFRIDGDGRYTEQKLSGWFDPPTVMKKGFSAAAFLPGPFVQAMKAGGVLFINELNRLPEGVQNVLLPAIDEGVIHIPRLGTITAKPGFAVIATQNPKEFVATSHLSEAILDRFELVTIAYQPENEECEIVAARLKPATRKRLPVLAAFAVKLARLTRDHARIRRGASIRAAIAVALLTEAFLEQGKELHAAFSTAALLALPTRLEVEPHVEDGEEATDLQSLIAQWVNEVLGAAPSVEQKKKKSQRL